MKRRSTAMLVASGVIAIASLAYVAPVLAEDDNNINTMQTEPALDNYAQNQSTETVGSSSDNTGSSSTMNSNTDNNNNNTSSSGSSNTDQATPDTATGDDDY